MGDLLYIACLPCSVYLIMAIGNSLKSHWSLWPILSIFFKPLVSLKWFIQSQIFCSMV